MGGSSSESSTGTPAPAHVRVAGKFNLGMNLSGISYYNNTPMYSDVMMQTASNGGPWQTSAGATVPIDATGAPTLAAVTMFTGAYPTGTYTLTWDGTGSLTFLYNIGKMGAVTSQTTNGVQHNTMTWTYTQDAAQFAWLSATPPVTNIHLMVPSEDQIPGSLFLAEFEKKLRPFSTLRFMDLLASNGNLVKNWSERTWPSEGSRAKPDGIAYEDMIQLSNELGTDVYVNVPVLATDDYICRLARLLKYGEAGDKSDGPCDPSAPGAAGAVKLNPNLRIYVELGNEIWNGGFDQVHQVYCMANGVTDDATNHRCHATAPTSVLAAQALANSALPWATNDPVQRQRQLTAVLTKRNRDLFRAVFGADAGRISVTLNVQSAYPASGDATLAFMKAAYGTANQAVDAVAVAPYFGPADETNDVGSVDAVFADVLTKGLQVAANWIDADVAEAKAYGLPLIAYEGGQGFNGTTYELAAQSDPRMFQAYQMYFDLWKQKVGSDSLFTVFAFSGGQSQYGAWGTLIELYQPGTQKFDALLSLTRLQGDADLNGVVDAADCAILKANYGQSSMWWMQGDFNHDGKVDEADLALLNANIVGPACTL